MFFSLPYDKGWKVTVDGKPVATFPIDRGEDKVKQEDGSYERLSETQTEYIHDGDALIRLADENGFEVAEVLSSADLHQHGQGEKAFYVLIRK